MTTDIARSESNLTMPKAPLWIAITVLGIAILEMPIGYYTFSRIIVCAVMCWAAFVTYQQGNQNLPYVYGALALLFNPIIPIYLHDREIWALFDVVAIVALASGYKKLTSLEVNCTVQELLSFPIKGSEARDAPSHTSEELGSGFRIGRLAYFILAFFLTAAVGIAEELPADQGTFVSFLFMPFLIALVIARLNDIGMSKWWAIAALVPIVGFVVQYFCLAYQRGYQESRKLDGVGRGITVALLGFLALGAASLFAPAFDA